MLLQLAYTGGVVKVSTVFETVVSDASKQLRAQLVLDIYYDSAIHLPYPPTFLQMYEDCEASFAEEFVYYVTEHNLFKRYNVGNFNELVFAVNTGKIKDHIIEQEELHRIIQSLYLNLGDYKDEGVW